MWALRVCHMPPDVESLRSAQSALPISEVMLMPYRSPSDLALMVFKPPVGGCFVQCGMRPHCLVALSAHLKSYFHAACLHGLNDGLPRIGIPMDHRRSLSRCVVIAEPDQQGFTSSETSSFTSACDPEVVPISDAPARTSEEVDSAKHRRPLRWTGRSRISHTSLIVRFPLRKSSVPSTNAHDCAGP